RASIIEWTLFWVASLAPRSKSATVDVPSLARRASSFCDQPSRARAERIWAEVAEFCCLMRHEGHPYYVAFLKAAELHGATHQAVMEFQVATDKRLPRILAGRSIITF